MDTQILLHRKAAVIEVLPREKQGAYVRACVLSVVRRARQREARQSLSALALEDLRAMGDDAFELVDERSNCLAALASRDLLECVEHEPLVAALCSLPAEGRLLLNLRFVHDQTAEQIAAVTRSTSGAVHKRIQRLIARLSELLADA